MKKSVAPMLILALIVILTACGESSTAYNSKQYEPGYTFQQNNGNIDIVIADNSGHKLILTCKNSISTATLQLNNEKVGEYYDIVPIKVNVFNGDFGNMSWATQLYGDQLNILATDMFPLAVTSYSHNHRPFIIKVKTMSNTGEYDTDVDITFNIDGLYQYVDDTGINSCGW